MKQRYVVSLPTGGWEVYSSPLKDATHAVLVRHKASTPWHVYCVCPSEKMAQEIRPRYEKQITGDWIEELTWENVTIRPVEGRIVK